MLISADMEGATGVTNLEDVVQGQPEYGRFRRLMTGDVNAAVAGAFEAGATEVLVNDSHWSMRNILIEELDPRAELISGIRKPLCMMEGLGIDTDAVFLVGYHARAGTDRGVFNHTMYGREVLEVRVNGQPVGEAALNAAIAGAYGVPVALVAGDDKACAEVRGFLGDRVETVAVKVGIDRFTARCLPPSEAQRRIREAAARALRRLPELEPYLFRGPASFEIDFLSSAASEIALLIPGVTKTSARTIAFERPDYLEAFKLSLACMALAYTTSDVMYG